MPVTFRDGPPVTRQCGDCQLCCKLLPVVDNEPWRPGPALNKPAGARCRHQKHRKGCAVYGKPQMPYACKTWQCRWIVSSDTADMPRPDRAHYVLDVLPDFITIRHDETGEEQHVQVVQVWIDPDYPDAHRDPALRRYLERRGEEGTAALIRFNSRDSITLIPPQLAADHQWHEVTSGVAGEQHTLEDLERAMGDKVTMVLSDRR